MVTIPTNNFNSIVEIEVLINMRAPSLRPYILSFDIKISYDMERITKSNFGRLRTLKTSGSSLGSAFAFLKPNLKLRMFHVQYVVNDQCYTTWQVHYEHDLIKSRTAS